MAYPKPFKWPPNKALSTMSKKEASEWMNEYRKNQGIIDVKSAELNKELEEKMAVKKEAKIAAKKARKKKK